jgi:beta-glucanase (GH16 family)
VNVGLSDSQLCHRRRSTWIRIILAGIVGLIAFYTLTGCAEGGSTPGASPTATPASKNQASPWKLIWNDEFDGRAGAPPDPSKWTPDIGGNGWNANQLEYNTDNLNAYHDGQGNLVLEARKVHPKGLQCQHGPCQDTSAEDNPEGLQCWYGPCQYTSARINTSDHFSFTYGLIVARIKIPYGQGLWSGFWLLGSNFETVGWPACGEIDVMENFGKKEPATIHGSVHSPGTPPEAHTLFTDSYTLPHGRFADDFHVFALQWDPDHLYFFVDGINYATLDKATLTNQENWVFDHPFHIILNVAVGGNWPGSPDSTTVFPQRMSVSYVRVYQNE